MRSTWFAARCATSSSRAREGRCACRGSPWSARRGPSRCTRPPPAPPTGHRLLERRYASSFDFGTLLAALALMAVGIVMVGSLEEGSSGPSTLAQKQALALGIGTLLFLVLVAVDYHTLAAFALPLYLAGLSLLVLVLLVGRTIANTHSWIELGPLRVQPSEPMEPLN